MPKSKDHDREGKHEHEHHRRPEGESEESDAPKRHAGIIARRWLGSPQPTAQRYALALRQWQNLPGAVSRQPVDLTVPADTPAPNSGPCPTYSADEGGES